MRHPYGGDLSASGESPASMGGKNYRFPRSDHVLYGAMVLHPRSTLLFLAMSVAAGMGNICRAVTPATLEARKRNFGFRWGMRPRSLICHLDGDGSGAFLVGRQKSHVRITGVTVGKIVDYGLEGIPGNMGACMAPAAADTILTNLKDFGRSPTSMTGSLQEISRISDRVFYWIL